MSMGASGAAGPTDSSQWRSPATRAASPSSASSADSSLDGIQVNLPNGFSVGVFRITSAPGESQGTTTPVSRGNASSAQMLQTAEELVADFASVPARSNGAARANPSDFAATLASGQSLDGIEVGLPNGYSAEIYYVDQSGQTSGDQMVDTMQQLVSKLATYPATIAG